MDGTTHQHTVRKVKSGPHVEKKLSAAFVRSAPPGRHWDGGGLYLQVDANGARRWMLRTTVQGRRRDLSVGAFRLFSLQEARDKAIQMRRVARQGGDPTTVALILANTGIGPIEPKEPTLTLRQAAEEYHRVEILATCRDAKHKAQWLNTLKNHIFPHVGDKAIRDVSTRDLDGLIRTLRQEKPETGKRVLQRLGVVFSWAHLNGYCSETNPAHLIKEGQGRKKMPPVKHFAALDWGEIPNLMRELKEVPGVARRPSDSPSLPRCVRERFVRPGGTSSTKTWGSGLSRQGT